MSELKLQQCRLDGRYDILECLGRGSYSEIFLARDLSVGGGAPHYVVIKALNAFLQGSIDQDLERTLIANFRNEAVALDRVRHPNIINRLGHGTAIDLSSVTFHYLVLEYLPGGDMSALCRKSPLTLDDALFYVEQICEGLAFAHENEVIHRDIKPQNLLLTADRQILKIADFGVAKIESVEGLITRVGTDVYAAPEHHPLLQTGMLNTGSLTQPVTLLTPAADIYSLAKTTYMILTGEAPRRFSLKQISDLPEHLTEQPWASFVLRVLRKATETNPAKRYQMVHEFWDELRDAAMPKTRLLSQPPGEETQPLASLGKKGQTAPLPPEPLPAQFEPPSELRRTPLQAPARPRIVVPINLTPATPVEKVSVEKPSEAKPETLPARVAKHSAKPAPAVASPSLRAANWNLRRWLVAFLLIAGFALMLLGTDRFVRSRQRTSPGTTATGTSAPLQIGREMLTTTNVNVRTGPGRNFDRLGILGTGSRVRILQVSGNWVEVALLEASAASEQVAGLRQGWIDGTKLR
ncbi:MAG: protein kinase [Pyrinomonadaceae bacterium]|nr:protein kinase [Pyrinomonadaceae bacterium]MDQ3133780.1 protein kinase [Acidobacteriota bacterium]